MARRLDSSAPSFAVEFRALVDERRATAPDVARDVSAIIADVKTRGDRALIDYTKRFDRMALTADRLRISPDEIDAASRSCPPKVIDALKFAAARIEAYHAHQRPEALDYKDALGVRLGARWRPIAAAGLYVPGGTASYPSSVLMNVLPAKVAGVERIVMVVPTPDGALEPAVLAAAKLAGVSEIYRIGGAQAVAALAFGTATIAPVDKIVGPGNAYVAEAKRQVYGVVGIDSIAGPSEILVVSDAKSDPAWIAADLLSQAEHDEAAQAILITDDAGFASRVEAEVTAQLTNLPRGNIAAASWARFGATIVVKRLDEAPALIDAIAPEHLELALDDPAPLAHAVQHAGAIFLGRHTPEAIGDYVAGPNHVLPTSRSARFSSGLGVLDFMTRSSIVACDASSFAALAPAAITLAEIEGLSGHARALSIRLGRSSDK
ncbi:MAG: histidinol dehydrogenase [Alphaproteobacteria bacterium]|nr:histidinol dehydrogenase [Alphaproteobacteria bacterium]